MRENSQQLLHAGINFIITPPPNITLKSVLAFQQALIESGLEYDKVDSSEPNRIVVIREKTSPLTIIAQQDAQNRVGQLTILAPNPKTPLNTFVSEAEASAQAFSKAFPAQGRQVIQTDCTIRRLLATSKPHAFQELWEERLGQDKETLAIFGRPIRGGGLRFVMELVPNEPDPFQIEVKIESYLQDTSKIFVETQFTWPKLSNPGEGLNISSRVAQINDYMEQQVYKFLTGDLGK